MAMITLICPKCGGKAKLSLVDTTYVGPRRCWKCHEYFTITIENNRLTSCEPLSQEEFERQQEAKKAAEKAQGGINFSRQEEPEIPQAPPVKQLNFIDSLTPKEPSMQTEQVKPAASFPPDRINTFIPVHDIIKEPEKPRKHKSTPEKRKDYNQSSGQAEPGKQIPVFPPDRIRTFVPLEDTPEEPE